MSEKANIMIVEDERIIAEDIKKSLTNFGYNVLAIYSSGEEALEKMWDLDVDLILMDIILNRELTGIDTAERIFEKKYIPLIFLTAYSDESTLERAKKVEPYGFITKPYDENTLRTTIETALYKHGMEKRLREKEEIIRTERDKITNILDSMEDGIYIVDENFMIEYINPAFEREFGSTQHKNCYSYFHSRTEKCSWCIANDVFGGETIRREVEFPNNKTYDVIDTPIKNPDGSTAKLAIYRDITEKKKYEKEQERLNDELKSINRELESVIYVASHDLRSPLVNIQGFSEELINAIDELKGILEKSKLEKAEQEKIQEIMKDDIQESLRYIISSTIRLDTMLTGLLRISRLGQEEIIFEKVEMDFLFKEVMSAFEFSLKEKGANLVVEQIPDCYGNALQINQLFSNLIDNAIKYLDKERKGEIRVSGKKDQDYIIYSVEDNGVGISEQDRLRIFEIFNRINPEMAKGEGLGLAIVRKIVKKHKGSIWIESEPGKGSCFFIKLPDKTD